MAQNQKKKRIWLWVLGWIFCFPIPLTLLIVRSNWKKGIKIALLVILWSLIGFGLLTDATGVSKPKEEKIEIQEENLSLEEKIEKAKDAISDFKNCEWEVLEEDKMVTLNVVFDQSFWNETSFINDAFSDYVDFCRNVYALEEIDEVNYSVATKMMDQKGNEDYYVVFQMCMKKDPFLEYNWDNMKYKGNVYNNIVSDSKVFWIHPGILKEFNEKEFTYQ